MSETSGVVCPSCRHHDVWAAGSHFRCLDCRDTFTRAYDREKGEVVHISEVNN